MIIIAYHSHICWWEMDVFKISVPNGIAVCTFDNTMMNTFFEL